jgi:hypothetical protein
VLVFLCLCYHKVSDNFTYMTCYSIPFYFSDKRQVTGSCFKTEIHTFTAIIIAETYLRRITKFLSLLGKMSRCDKILSEYVPFFISSQKLQSTNVLKTPCKKCLNTGPTVPTLIKLLVRYKDVHNSFPILFGASFF